MVRRRRWALHDAVCLSCKNKGRICWERESKKETGSKKLRTDKGLNKFHKSTDTKSAQREDRAQRENESSLEDKWHLLENTIASSAPYLCCLGYSGHHVKFCVGAGPTVHNSCRASDKWGLIGNKRTDISKASVCVSPYLPIACILNVWLQKIKERKGKWWWWWGVTSSTRGVIMTYRTASDLQTHRVTLSVLIAVSHCFLVSTNHPLTINNSLSKSV